MLELDLCAASWYLWTTIANAGGLEGVLLEPINASASHTFAPVFAASSKSLWDSDPDSCGLANDRNLRGEESYYRATTPGKIDLGSRVAIRAGRLPMSVVRYYCRGVEFDFHLLFGCLKV
ncbi:hypothetical protein HAX54_040344 [Datura stramonium]|uniref:Uncharacterized protein n=1 Tax=Datura stramonium TaxID=4076 RepID=A0ABS8VMJ0_DATST|nr:hypothetical protein [Datura stramonium]